MKRTVKFGEYFCGNKISEYGLKNGFVDYRTLAKAFDAVLCNDIIAQTDAAGLGYWALENGDFDYYENENGERLTESEFDELPEEDQEKCEHYSNEIFQYYIISENGAQILEDYTDEIVFYNETLDLYIWGVTHCGTAWDYVCTDIPCGAKDGE